MCSNIEAREMENFKDVFIGEQRLEIRRVILSRCELNQMGVAVARRKLDEAQTVACGIESHRFRVDRH